MLCSHCLAQATLPVKAPPGKCGICRNIKARRPNTLCDQCSSDHEKCVRCGKDMTGGGKAKPGPRPC